MWTPYEKTGSDGVVLVQGKSLQRGAFNQALSRVPSKIQAAQYQTPRPSSRGCRDAIFAVLFYVHLCLIVWAAAKYVPVMVAQEGANISSHFNLRRLTEDANAQDQDGSFNFQIDTAELVTVLAVSATLAFLMSSIALAFMTKCAKVLIQTALIFNVIFFLILMSLSFAFGSLGTAIVCLILAVLSSCYAFRVWDRIAFAAANLATAVTAVRANVGLAVYAYWSVIVLFFWSVAWSLAAVSTIFVKANCSTQGQCEGQVSGFLIFLFLLSYYWTSQVIANVVTVTTAGTVGTWWFYPLEARSCCSKAVRDSYGRSLTTSFGSICLGSLLVAIVQALQETVYQMRDGDDSMLACIAGCILGCIESLLEYFNKWAFVYVGLYGFSFVEAGRNAMKLFRARGWTTIITDTMVDTVLFMVSLGVALFVGVISLAVGAAMNKGDYETMGSAFLVGLLVGYAICATLLSLVGSSVNTVIVCYAEAPNEFQANHPELSETMRSSWSDAWPGEFNY